MHTKAFLMMILLFLGMGLKAQKTVSDLDENFKKIYKDSDFPGFAVAIVKDDSVLFSNCYGFANVRDKISFTERTIMPIASVSKTVIAFSLAKAFELGYFTAETPINEILPFEVINPYHPDDVIRVKHLFTHTSGILDNDTTFISSYQIAKIPDMPMGDFLKSCLNKNGRYYSPSNFDTSKTGTKYNYSNIASALAAFLIEYKSGLSFNEFTQKYIFEPLQLESTHWFYDEKRSDDYANLYEVNVPKDPLYNKLMNKDGSVKNYTSIIYPDGSLKSSLRDLTSYVREIIKGYNGYSDLLTKESCQAIIDKTFDDNSLPANISQNMTNQAMFWSYNRKDRLTHTGSDPGVFAVISIDLTTNIGRIVLINANIDTHNNQKLINDLRLISDHLEMY